MEMTLDMPLVSTCDITDCAYNRGNNCHARAITIGDGVHPGCDTFFSNDTHTRETGRIAGVGACKIDTCSYNEDFECSAESIEVSQDNFGVRCMTFTM